MRREISNLGKLPNPRRICNPANDGRQWTNVNGRAASRRRPHYFANEFASSAIVAL